MRQKPLDIVICGLSITSSWGNGHATTYRALVRELSRRGHRVLFLERDVPWYADNRDLPEPPYGTTRLYGDLAELTTRYRQPVADADLVIVGSYVPDGVAVGEWVLSTAGGLAAFYDIDTPVTLAKFRRGDYEYLTPSLLSRYDLYLSFTGGPILEEIETCYDCPAARPLYCSVDPHLYYPEPVPAEYDLGYLGTYSDDRQPPLERMMLDAARAWTEGRFVVAGPQYPKTVAWPGNVVRIDHLPPSDHCRFYNTQHYTLNVTRADMIEAGYSPSVRLFEAAACAIPIISDRWTGLDTFFKPDREIFISRSGEETLRILKEVPEETRRAMGERAREKVLSRHTAAHRARELEAYVEEVTETPSQWRGMNGNARFVDPAADPIA